MSETQTMQDWKNPKSVSVPSLYLEQIDTATENANTYPTW